MRFLGLLWMLLTLTTVGNAFPKVEDVAHPLVQQQIKRWKTDHWQELLEYSELRSYRRGKDTAPWKSMGGEGIVEAPIAQVLALVFDVNHAPDWVYRVKRANFLEESRDLRHVTQYTAIDLPFPFTDRDFVVTYDVQPDPATGAVTIFVEPATHPAAPASIGVRARIRGRYDFIPVSANAVYCRIEIEADPGGSLADWITSMLQGRWPLVTLYLMRETFKEKQVTPLPQYALWMGKTNASQLAK